MRDNLGGGGAIILLTWDEWHFLWMKNSFNIKKSQLLKRDRAQEQCSSWECHHFHQKKNVLQRLGTAVSNWIRLKVETSCQDPKKYILYIKGHIWFSCFIMVVSQKREIKWHAEIPDAVAKTLSFLTLYVDLFLGAFGIGKMSNSSYHRSLNIFKP